MPDQNSPAQIDNAVLTAEEVKEIEESGRASQTLADLRADLGAINARLAADAGDLSPSAYIESRRYLGQLDQALKALEDPNASKYFNGSWKARGQNVAELIDHLKNRGLRFAPATPGKEAAYTALYNALRNYEAATRSSH